MTDARPALLFRLRALAAVLSLAASLLVALSWTVAKSAGSAAADTPPPPAMPSTIGLSADKSVFAVGESVTLTASTDAELAASASVISITDETSHTTLTTCSAGTSCSVSTSFATGGPHSYLATVNELTSNEITLSRQAWAVTLTVDNPTVTAGQPATLTAAANQELSGSYSLFIFDTTTQEEIAQCKTGQTCTGTVPYVTGDPHNYRAEVADVVDGATTLAGATDVQATSDAVTLTRQAWSLTLTVDNATFPVGGHSTLTATANQDVGATGGTYSLLVFDETTRVEVAQCLTGTTCVFDAAFFSGPAHTYVAEVADAVGERIDLADATDVQATSNEVQVSRQPWTVSLTVDHPTFVVGQPVTLTATANQGASSQYSIYIFDERTGQQITTCSQGTVCTGDGSFSLGPAHNYVAEIAQSSSDRITLGDAQDVQATSDEVTVARESWVVTLSTSQTVLAAGEHATLTATANQDVSFDDEHGGYSLFIYDLATGAAISKCGPEDGWSRPTSGPDGSFSCTVSVSPYWDVPHQYVAYISDRSAENTDDSGTVSDLQATSNQVVEIGEAWTVTLAQTGSYQQAGGPDGAILTATANQNSSQSPFQVYFIDYTRNSSLSYCAGFSCTLQLPTGLSSDVIVAYVSQSGVYGSDSPVSDVMAISNGYSAAVGGGAILPGESSGGSNPAEKNCQCSHADPVNTATGELYQGATDLGLPGKGPGLVVGRTYSSTSAATDGPFGYGWSASFGTHLQVVRPGNTADPLPRQVQIVQETGATVVFAEDGNQHYLAPARVLASLSWDATAQLWTFTRQSRQILLFNSDGRLVALRDLHDNSVNLSYDSSGRVASLTASGGRSLTMTWTGSHLSQITDSAGRSVSYTYDSLGNLVAVTAVDGAVTSYGYNPGHYLTAVTRPGGGTTTSTYDGQQRVVSQQDPLGRLTTFSYSGSSTTTTTPDGAQTVEIYQAGELQSQTKAAGTSLAATVNYSYDSSGNVASVADPTGQVTRYTYDPQGNELTSTDPLNHVTSFSYDGLDDVTSVTDPLGRRAIATYDAAGDRTSTTSPSLRTQHWTYNPDGTVATFVDARGMTTIYGYNAAGDQVSITDPDGRVKRLGYNAAGMVTSDTDPSGELSQITVDAAGRTRTITDPDGHRTTYGYDPDGNRISTEDGDQHAATGSFDLADQLISTTDADGNSTQYGYTVGGYLASVTDPDGHRTTYGYDPLGEQTAVTDPGGHTTGYTYDGDGRQVSTTLPSGAVSSLSYDAAGRVVSSTNANSQTTHYGYDADGELVSTTDPLDRTTGRSYTVDGQLDTLTQPDGSSKTYTYNADSLPTDVGNADGKHTTYSYDAADLLVGRTEPGGLHTGYSYDVAGRLQVTTQPDLSTSTMTYSDSGLLTRVHYSAAGSSDVSYSYDAAGHRQTMVDATGTTSYSYDDSGRLTGETNGAGSQVDYSYDAAGKVSSIRYPGDRTVSYSYDSAGRLASLTDWASRTVQFGWTADGQLGTQTDPNGVTQTTSYDPTGQITAINTATDTSTLASYSYGYDAADQLISDSVPTPDGSVNTGHSYGYDLTSQIGAVVTTPPSGITIAGSYSATAAGSLTGTPDGAVLTYNGAQELTGKAVSSGAQTSYSYDANGSRVASVLAASDSAPAQTTQYSYDAAANLSGVTAADTSVSYTSDGDGLRQSRTVGSATKSFLWDTSGNLPLLLDDGDHSYLYGPSSSPVAQIDDSTGTIEYLHGDNLGSVRLITSAAGAVVGSSSYDAYGSRIGHNGPADSVFGFTGNWTDPATGLVYLRARDFDPATGQFLTVDPLVDSTGQPYAYVGNDPLDATDPTGQCLLGRSNGRCRGGGVLDDVVLAGPSAHTLQSGVVGAAVSFFEGVGDGASFGLTQKARDLVDPRSECFVQHDGFYFAGTLTGVVATTVLLDGLGADGDPEVTFNEIENSTKVEESADDLKIYRGMRAEGDGLPKIDASARGLGARPSTDIPVDEGGYVQPGTGGMSVSPDSPMNLPGFRRPPEFGGTGRDPLFCMSACDLPDGLSYRPDPNNPFGHGFVEPSFGIPFADYQQLISGTRGLWTQVLGG